MSVLTVGFLRQVADESQALADGAQAAWATGFAGMSAIEAEAWLSLAVAARQAIRALEARPAPREIDSDRALVKRLLAIEDGLSEWELRFIESIARWVEGQALTPAQRNRAEQLDAR